MYYDFQLDLDKALALYQDTERICREANLPGSLQIALGNQGLVHWAQGRLDEALALLRRQDQFCRETNQPDGLQRAWRTRRPCSK